jgi:hypothetical protein
LRKPGCDVASHGKAGDISGGQARHQPSGLLIDRQQDVKAGEHQVAGPQVLELVRGRCELRACDPSAHPSYARYHFGVVLWQGREHCTYVEAAPHTATLPPRDEHRHVRRRRRRRWTLGQAFAAHGAA